ncbi:hypothetical protein KBJ98_02095 [Flavobacterium sp. F-328]|uniref:Haemolysin XhlA n=1 Tax=Flavobacterium erciyesense TaxID=2825842 RepID=A0ABS5D0F4_9FLAO|nr:hypothetical protein [Flavobacterium erciyesense]MBQ0907487.1 hypothetical protein [Flavobacterium erciyesense]
MNVEDRQIMSQIEKDIAEIKTALLGSSLSGDKGLTGRIKDLENRLKILELEKSQNHNLNKVIIWLASIIVVGLLGLIFNYFKK